MWKGFAWLMKRPGFYALATRFTPWALELHPIVKGTVADPVRSWTKTRDFPEAPPRTFRDLWRERKEAKR
jgi:hypothetical protein